MGKFRTMLNNISQAEDGDKSLRVDREDLLIQRFHGSSGSDQKYHIHKDSYVHDANNELDGMDLRKLTMVIFLNDGDGLDEVRKSSDAKMGSLRLYTKGTNATDGLVDIIPRMGRAVLFKSEHMLHKVNPTFGYDNWQVTAYFTQVVNKPPIDHPIPNDWKIFIGVAAYRDL